MLQKVGLNFKFILGLYIINMRCGFILTSQIYSKIKGKINMRPEEVEELRRIAAEIESLDQCHGSGLMIPYGNHVNSSRAAMTYQQIPQAKSLDNPEIARTSTGYEKLYGDRSTSYLKMDRDYEVIKKIQKFDNSDLVYALILKEIGKDYYHIVFRAEVESFAESSGVKINNTIIDSMTEGSRINKDDIISRSNSYNDDMNYRYGVNGKVLYLVDPGIVEDAIRISTPMAEKLRCTSVVVRNIPKNSNDILLNYYGTSKVYKVIPEIGEMTKDGILCIRRRISYTSAQYTLKNRNLRREMFGDVTHFASGRVVDIDIYSNTPLSEIPDDPANAQIKKYLSQITNYWTELYDSLKDIIEDSDNKYSDDIGVTFARARDVLSIGKYVKWNNEQSMFDGMIINITVEKSTPATVGSKLVGRHGNKGVISEIVDEKYMPTSEDGEVAEAIFDALGVIGRLNQSQLKEHEGNWIVDTILQGGASREQKFKSLMELLSIVNPRQEKIVQDCYDELSDDERKKFIKDLTTDFVLFQSASNAMTFKQYAELIDRFNPKKKRFTITDKDSGKTYRIKKPLIMADSYILRLKHEPITKFSVRSKGTINPRTFLPIKSHSYSRGTALFNNQAVRFGNMEMDVLYLCNDPAAINYMTRLYCTSVTGRREFDKLMTTNIFGDELIIEMANYRSRVVDMFIATLVPCGLGLELEFGDTTEVQNTVMKDLRKMSKQNIKILFKEPYNKKY